MQIAVVSVAGERGGTEQATLNSIALLQEAGHSCRVLVVRPIGELAAELAARKIPFASLENPGPRGIWTFFQLRRWLRSWRPDAVILNGVDIDGMLAIGSVPVPAAKILISHDLMLHQTRPQWYLRIVYLVSRWVFQRLLFCSDALRRDAVRLSPAIAPCSVTLHNTWPELHAAAAQPQRDRKAFGLPEDVFLVGTAGRLAPGKRVDLLIEMAVQMPEVHFAIAGDGPLMVELQALARQRGVAERMHWLGWVDDLLPFLAALDVFTMSSDTEAFGLVAAEAMLVRVPVVASVLFGGLDELIDRPEYGVCLQEHDVPAMVSAIQAVRQGQSPISPDAARHAVKTFMSAKTHQEKLLAALNAG